MNQLTFRDFKAPQSDFFLFGPRGGGKSTWVESTYPEAALYMVYGGSLKYLENDIMMMPAEIFLRNPFESS